MRIAQERRDVVPAYLRGRGLPDRIHLERVTRAHPALDVRAGVELRDLVRHPGHEVVIETGVVELNRARAGGDPPNPIAVVFGEPHVAVWSRGDASWGSRLPRAE